MTTKFYTASEVAQMFRVHPSTITRLVRDGKLAVTRIGSRLTFTQEAIDEFVSRNTVASSPAAFDRKPRAVRSVTPAREQLREQYPVLRREA
jgi:excisionase family DNA binding protein